MVEPGYSNLCSLVYILFYVKGKIDWIVSMILWPRELSDIWKPVVQLCGVADCCWTQWSIVVCICGSLKTVSIGRLIYSLKQINMQY